MHGLPRRGGARGRQGSGPRLAGRRFRGSSHGRAHAPRRRGVHKLWKVPRRAGSLRGRAGPFRRWNHNQWLWASFGHYRGVARSSAPRRRPARPRKETYRVSGMSWVPPVPWARRHAGARSDLRRRQDEAQLRLQPSPRRAHGRAVVVRALQDSERGIARLRDAGHGAFR